MAQKTPNYNLNKPGYEDFGDVDMLNENFEKIDKVLAATDPTKVTAKAAPADDDGVMIADSADGSKAKRLPWSSIKTALGKLFVPLTRKVNGKVLTEDVTLTGENIAVSTTDSTPISGAVKYRTNPNLLDNWYFGRPVNQRGKTEYTAAGYTVDRWKNTSDAGAVMIADGKVVLQTTAAYAGITQTIEKTNNFRKKTVTLSVLCEGTLNGTYQAVIWYGNEYRQVLIKNQISSVSFTLPDNNEDILVCVQSNTAASSPISILAIKLELGSTQTLAHQDSSGNWILNEIPDFGEQLRRCQRYAVDDNYHTTVGQLNYDGDTYYISVQLPCVMRTIPVITLKEISAIGWGVLPISNAEITWRGANGFFVAIKDLSSMNNFIGKACRVTYFASADL